MKLYKYLLKIICIIIMCVAFSCCQSDEQLLINEKNESISVSYISTIKIEDNTKESDTFETSDNNDGQEMLNRDNKDQEVVIQNDLNTNDRTTVVDSYNSILKGDFTSIKDSDARDNMAYLLELEMQNGACNWQYLIHDFNNDDIEDLYIKFSETYDSALFTYESGHVKWIYIDTVEMNCYMYPLRSGEFVQVYDYWTAPTTTVFQLDSQFNWINSVQYIKSNQEDVIVNLNEMYGVFTEDVPETQEYRYYYNSPNDKHAISEEEWDQFQDYLRNNEFDFFELDQP